MPILLMLSPNVLQAESFTVGLYQDGLPPLMFPENDVQKGIYKDIFSEIEKITGYSFQYKYYPAARVNTSFENGGLDIEPGINPVWRQDSKVPGEYTIPFAKNFTVVLFAGGEKVAVNSLQDLKGKTIGTVRGYFYPGYMDEFAKKTIIRHDSTSEKQLLKMLAKGRLVQVFIDKAFAQYWMKESPAYKDFKIGNTINELDIMMRVHPQKKHHVSKINKALKQLLKAGTIEAIYEKYQ